MKTDQELKSLNHSKMFPILPYLLMQ